MVERACSRCGAAAPAVGSCATCGQAVEAETMTDLSWEATRPPDPPSEAPRARSARAAKAAPPGERRGVSERARRVDPTLRATIEAAHADPKKRLGPYLLLERLGQGAFGAVHRAWDTRRERLVAVKVLLHADPRARARFEREVKATARLRHPHIVPLHDSGEHDGTPFLVMDLIVGQTLEAAAGATPPLEPAEAAALLRDVASAVAYAHDEQVMHRDLKPQNVMIDGAGRAYVLDFGLAHLEDRQTRLTRTGGTLGTPAYMAPEQADGRAEHDVRSDVYGLGATLYQALTGRPPFQGQSLAELMVAVCSVDPAPPSAVRAAVPPDLDAICLRCLEKEPDARYATAHELVRDLERFLAGRPVAASAPTAFDRGLRWARRHRAIAGLAAATAATALSSAVLLAALLSRSTDAAPPREDAAVAPLDALLTPLPGESAAFRTGRLRDALRLAGDDHPRALAIRAELSALERDQAGTEALAAALAADGEERGERLARFVVEHPTHPRWAEGARALDEFRSALTSLVERARRAEAAGDWKAAADAWHEAGRQGAVEAGPALEQIRARAAEQALALEEARVAAAAGDVEAARAAIDRARALGARGDDELAGLVGGQRDRARARADAARAAGDWPALIEALRALEALDVDVHDELDAARAAVVGLRAEAEARLRDAEQARRWVAAHEAAIDVERLGGAHPRGALERLRGLAAMDHGRWDEALEALEAAAEVGADERVALEAQNVRMLRLGLQLTEVAGEYRNPKDGSVLVLVPSGTFIMGNATEGHEHPLERPARSVTLSSYLIGRHEVRWAQYREFCEATGRPVHEAVAADRLDHPAHGVLFEEAVAYCAWAGLRLPSEAEWERAARGDDGRPFPWGVTPPTPARAVLGRPRRDGAPATERVDGPSGRSPFGCEHMAGNVFEWVADLFGRYPFAGDTDPRGPATGKGRVLRGGAFYSTPTDARTTSRRSASVEPPYRDPGVGFRVARDAR